MHLQTLVRNIADKHKYSAQYNLEHSGFTIWKHHTAIRITYFKHWHLLSVAAALVLHVLPALCLCYVNYLCYVYYLCCVLRVLCVLSVLCELPVLRVLSVLCITCVTCIICVMCITCVTCTTCVTCIICVVYYLCVKCITCVMCITCVNNNNTTTYKAP